MRGRAPAEALGSDEQGNRASQEPAVAGVRAAPPEDAVHGRCAEWLRSFVFKNKREPFIQEVWDAARPPAAPQQEQTP